VSSSASSFTTGFLFLVFYTVTLDNISVLPS